MGSTHNPYAPVHHVLSISFIEFATELNVTFKQ